VGGRHLELPDKKKKMRLSLSLNVKGGGEMFKGQTRGGELGRGKKRSRCLGPCLHRAKDGGVGFYLPFERKKKEKKGRRSMKSEGRGKKKKAWPCAISTFLTR